ncbi:hypothetical protein DFH06DRAFT_630227 [Mycena polygramma]|nr:hypothetical protein DFH06DRAFT_630227 [Mycena polygramma]
MPSLVNTEDGSLEDAVRRACAIKPSFLVIDDLTFGASASYIPELITQIDAIEERGEQLHVICTTSSPWRVEALFPRFTIRIFTPLPDLPAREFLFETLISSINSPVTLEPGNIRLLAQRAAGYSLSDIRNVMHSASLSPIRSMLQATHFKPVYEDGVCRWTPCNPEHLFAVPKTYQDLEEDEVASEPSL